MTLRTFGGLSTSVRHVTDHPLLDHYHLTRCRIFHPMSPNSKQRLDRQTRGRGCRHAVRTTYGKLAIPHLCKTNLLELRIFCPSRCVSAVIPSTLGSHILGSRCGSCERVAERRATLAEPRARCPCQSHRVSNAHSTREHLEFMLGGAGISEMNFAGCESSVGGGFDEPSARLRRAAFCVLKAFPIG